MRFYFFRHSLKQSNGLISREGKELARQVGRRIFADKKLSKAVCSFQARTLETAVALMWPPDFHDTFPGGYLDSPNLARWNELIQAGEGQVDPKHPFIQDEAARMVWEFKALSAWFSPDKEVLAIGHAGLLETLIWALTGVMLKPLRECEGAIVDFDGSEFTLVEELRRS